jgi:hypothetical protein
MWRVCERRILACEWGIMMFRSRKSWTVNLCDDCLEEPEERGIDLFGGLECACGKTEVDEN